MRIAFGIIEEVLFVVSLIVFISAFTLIISTIWVENWKGPITSGSKKWSLKYHRRKRKLKKTWNGLRRKLQGTRIYESTLAITLI